MTKLKLHPYQLRGADWLSSRKAACLFDEMGIGKSAQAIHACDLVGAKQILVICRAVARENWRREFEKFSTTERSCDIVYSGSDVHGLRSGIVICSYEAVPHILGDSTRRFDCVIVDESHYLKEPNAARTRNVLGKAGAIHRGKQTFLLTGTPTPNHAGELWTTLYTLGNTKLGYDEFIERYCATRLTAYGRQIIGSTIEPDKIAELKRMLGNSCLRRTKEDVNLELPPISYSEVIVKPGKVDLLMCHSFRKYVIPEDCTADLEALIEKELGVIKGIINGGFTEEAMRALEANSKNIMTLRRYNSAQKVEPIADLVIQELKDKAYGKIVIFAIHRDTIMGLQDKFMKALGKQASTVIFGGTPPKKLQDRIDRFQGNGTLKVLIAQLHCAGTSLTLTAANHIIFADLDWVPGNNSQAAARCHRIGQTKPVTARCIALENSIDQHIASILARKTREINTLMDGAMGGQKEKVTINQLL